MRFSLLHVIVLSAMITTVCILFAELYVEGARRESLAHNGKVVCDVEECVACLERVADLH